MVLDVNDLVLGAALIRAYHTRFDEHPLIEDPLAERLISRGEREDMLQKLAGDVSPHDPDGTGDPARRLYQLLRTRETYGRVLARCRYVEDLLSTGTKPFQFVNIAAGLDTWPFRHGDRGIAVYELDDPAMLASKRERLLRAGFRVPWNVVPVAADLEREPLDSVLSNGNFAPDQKSLFACLGPVPFLSRGRMDQLFAEIADLAAPGSMFVFDYLQDDFFENNAERDQFQRLQAEEQAGAVLSHGFKPKDLHAGLLKVGFELVEDLDGLELTARFCADREDGLTIPAPFRILRAVRAG